METMTPAAVRAFVGLTFAITRAEAIFLLMDAYSRDNQFGERAADHLFCPTTPEPQRRQLIDMSEHIWRMRCQHDTPNDAFLALMMRHKESGRWPWDPAEADTQAA